MSKLKKKLEAMPRFGDAKHPGDQMLRAVRKDPDKAHLYSQVRQLTALLLETATQIEQLEARISRMENIRGIGRS
jgi:hypothetical protein